MSRRGNSWLAYPIPLPNEDIVPLVEGAQVEGENSDADDEHVVQDETSEPSQATPALEERQ